jgi:uncharacterized Zn-binding protein involved in type VI secretion
MAFAARVGDLHVCPMVTGVVPHVGGTVLPPGCPTVLIGGAPAARVGDMLTCTGPPDTIAMGSATVLIGGCTGCQAWRFNRSWWNNSVRMFYSSNWLANGIEQIFFRTRLEFPPGI